MQFKSWFLILIEFNLSISGHCFVGRHLLITKMTKYMLWHYNALSTLLYLSDNITYMYVSDGVCVTTLCYVFIISLLPLASTANAYSICFFSSLCCCFCLHIRHTLLLSGRPNLKFNSGWRIKLLFFGIGYNNMLFHVWLYQSSPPSYVPVN